MRLRKLQFLVTISVPLSLIGSGGDVVHVLTAMTILADERVPLPP